MSTQFTNTGYFTSLILNHRL